MGNYLDRRRHQRFRVREESFAFIANGSKILCRIRNISEGGVSLITIANAEDIPELFDTDIFVAGRVFYLREIPSRKISESQMKSQGILTYFMKSRVNVKFLGMTDAQTAQLKLFLKNHATIEDISPA